MRKTKGSNVRVADFQRKYPEVQASLGKLGPCPALFSVYSGYYGIVYSMIRIGRLAAGTPVSPE